MPSYVMVREVDSPSGDRRGGRRGDVGLGAGCCEARLTTPRIADRPALGWGGGPARWRSAWRNRSSPEQASVSDKTANSAERAVWQKSSASHSPCGPTLPSPHAIVGTLGPAKPKSRTMKRAEPSRPYFALRGVSSSILLGLLALQPRGPRWPAVLDRVGERPPSSCPRGGGIRLTISLISATTSYVYSRRR